MASFEPTIESACTNLEIPGCVLVASNTTGSFSYQKAFGHTAAGQPVREDSMMWIASCTKLMTSVAALQQVERGRIGLDDDLKDLLPELAACEVLVGFEEAECEGRPKYEGRKGAITLRRMLTHSAGLSYAIFDQRLQRIHRINGTTYGKVRTVVEDYAEPLVFQPGEGWQYSTAIDWAGTLVERLSGQTLEEYLRENTWAPLGIKDITFWPDRDEGIRERMLRMSVGAENGSLDVAEGGNRYKDAKGCFGGGGAWATAGEYVKILRSLCANDGKLLGREMAEEMFRPQLNEVGKEALNAFRYDEKYSEVFGCGYVAKEQEFDYGLGGMLGLRDEQGWRRKGTLAWGGLANLIWFIDRETGLCGAYFGQYLPPGSPRVNELDRLFEKSMYQEYEEFKKSQ